MELQITDIKDLFVIKTTMHHDERGLFYRSYSEFELNQLSIHENFVHHNVSHNYHKGTIRGMHLQLKPFAETKIVRCVRGKIFDVAVDLRKGSHTFLKYFGLELSAQNANALLIPKGFAHGFQVLEDDSTLLYLHSAVYHSSSEFSINYKEPRIDIHWPLEIGQISRKDKEAEFLKNDFEGIEI